MLNTQGTTNRNLPDELEKFINVYNEKPHQKVEQVNHTNQKEMTTHTVVQNGVHHSPTLTQQVHEAPKIQSINGENVLKKDYFDDISKVIELENKSIKPQIFRKVNEQHLDVNNLDGFKFNGNHRVEKQTNFFETLNGKDSQPKQEIQPIAQLTLESNSSFVKTDGGIMALKNLSPSTVNGNAHIANGHSKEMNGVQESLSKAYISEKKANSIQEFNFAKPNLMDEYYFQSNEQNTLDSNGSNRSTAGPVLFRNYSSDSNDISSRSLLSKIRNNSGFQSSDRILSGPNSLTRPEVDSHQVDNRPAIAPLSKFANTLLNRPQISSFHKTNSKTNISQDFNGTSSEYRSTVNGEVPPNKPFDDKSTNIFNSAIEIGNSKRKQENGMSKFVNAPVELKPTIIREFQGQDKQTSNGSKLEEIKQNLIPISQSEISARAMAKINKSQPVNLYQPITLDNGKLQKIGSVETNTQPKNQMNNGGFYTPMEVKNFLKGSNNESKVNKTEFVSQEKNTLNPGVSNAILSKSNSLQTVGAQNKLVRTTTPLEFTVGHRDKLHKPKDDHVDRSNDQFITFMNSIQNDQKAKNPTIDAYRRTTNSFVNYNDEDNKKYLQTLSFVNSSKNINLPSLKTEGTEPQWNESLRGTLTSKRQTAPEHIGVANMSYNRSIPNFGSKLQSRPPNTAMNKTHFSRP